MHSTQKTEERPETRTDSAPSFFGGHHHNAPVLILPTPTAENGMPQFHFHQLADVTRKNRIARLIWSLVSDSTMTEPLSYFFSTLRNGYKADHNLEDVELDFALVSDSCRGLPPARALTYRLLRKLLNNRSRWESHCRSCDDIYGERQPLIMEHFARVLEENTRYLCSKKEKTILIHSRLCLKWFTQLQIATAIAPLVRADPSKEIHRFSGTGKRESRHLQMQGALGPNTTRRERDHGANEKKGASSLKKVSLISCSAGDRSPTMPRRSSDNTLPGPMSLTGTIQCS
jgi:hypothetical protein